MTTPKLSTHRSVAAVLLLLVVIVVTNSRTQAWTITSSQSALNGSNNSHRSTARSTSIVRRQANVATEILLSQIKDEEGAAGNSVSEPSSTTASLSVESKAKGKRRLTRSERKALEREKKAQNSTKKGNKGKKNNNYKLHSTAVSQLTASSTADDVVKAIKRAQKQHDHHDLRVIANFLIDECGIGFAYGYRGSLLARLAVAALRWENHEVARRAIEIRTLEYRASMRPMESAAIIRGLLRVHNVTDALDMIADELSLPMKGTDLETDENHDRIKHRARSLASVASRHLFEGEPSMAVLALQMLKDMGPAARHLTAEELEMPWLRLLSGAAQCEKGRRKGHILPCEGFAESVELPCNLAYSVLSAMSSFPSENDDSIYEALSNGLVRRVLFITGAIDMDGLPPPDRGEAAFIGRSNVGKSSLVNMITNRKSLAYTSNTPGKTQQFNYFAVNDKPGREKEIRYGDKVGGKKDDDSFYLVDLPGFGFAKVPDKQKKQWASFMGEYLENRKNLKVVFHLIDSRHGPLDEDSAIMKQVGEMLPSNIAYVIVLTKADKNVKGNSVKNGSNKPGKVSIDVMNKLREVMRDNNVGKAPVLLTSAENKLGRDDVWRYLRRAAEGK
eukprot:CAMPEP_0197178900 /NCGR_PEP_ID=MMETSP1423-20130617/4024_1 /TAXON_ID=476441 /ORGANISM="Pseudo-nitzschia heimii, Strain UNC1101" /LENGTH=616 /DNA_ID=CAMNT_0042628719 /DNA_START=144 /DNA_END=1994 /DNA_ORIENTATION=-